MGRTRDELHRLATHVLGRRRYEVSGRFGLRPSPGGVATPAFGPGPEVLRTDGTTLVHEVGDRCTAADLEGATLGQLAEFAGADLEADFSVGAGMIALGAVDEPLQLDRAELLTLMAWYELGARVLDRCVAALGVPAATVQLWPEHFDLATTLDLVGSGSTPVKVNVGFSGGDSFCDEPYTYVGPWDDARPGDPAYWNAPFGAFAARSRLGDGGDAVAAFIRTGLEQLSEG